MPHPPQPIPPILSVSHLHSATSFYISLLQPLGIVYLSPQPTHPAYRAPPCLDFGYLTPSSAGPRPLTVFSLTQANLHQPIRISHIVIPAESAKQVQDVWTVSKALLPRSRTNSLERIDDRGGERSVTIDLDGNIIEALYKPPPYTRTRTPPEIRPTRPATLDLPAGPPPGMNPDKDSNRVLQWQSDVARSVSPADLFPAATDLPIRIHVPRSDVSYRERERDEPITAGIGIGPGTFRRADTFPLERQRELPEQSGERLVRRETVMTQHYTREEPSERRLERRSSGGISGKAVMGTLLGAAAGAALAYVMVRSESPEPVSRRDSGKSFGSERVYKESSHYAHKESQRGIQMIDHDRTEILPARSLIHERGSSERGSREIQPRYVNYHVSVPPPAPSSRAHIKYLEPERIEYRASEPRGSDVGSRREPPPQPSVYTAAPSAMSRDRSPSRGGKSRVRSPSRSHVSHRSGAEARPREPSESRSHRDQSYTSARSHNSPSVISQSDSTNSGSTLRAEQELLAKVPTPPSAVSKGSGAPRDGGGRSHVSHRSSGSKAVSRAASMLHRETDSREYRGERESEVGGGGHHREWRSTVTGRSAREVPLPRSTVGYEYAASVAPSDSVSSVGSKRERERLRDRMRERTSGIGGW